MPRKTKQRDTGRRLVEVQQAVYSIELESYLEVGQVVNLNITTIAPKVFDDGYLKIIGLAEDEEEAVLQFEVETEEVSDGTSN